jgi:asparagine synthase (glutamine-hydrolysing)
MCGVAGIYASTLSPPPQRYAASVEALTASLYRRGPDARGVYESDRAVLAHTRLAIVDPDPRANQPMESEDWVLSYNGEIYNYRQIRDELGTHTNFRTSSDTEVLLLAIQEWGLERALAKCAGMFAFLAYSKRDGRLYAVRDRLGIKPLFLTRLKDGTYFFASSPAAIVNALPHITWSEYRPAIASYFVLGAPFTTTSVIAGIERVEPAHYVVVYPNGAMAKRRYWEPEYQSDFTMADLVNVVKEYENSDVASALFLSGGVDSSFLASVFDRLDCFHLKSSESHYASAVARRFGRRFIEVEPALDDYVDGIRQVCQVHGEPYMSCGIPNSVSRAISQHGYKMAVIANGADELFHGYPRTPIPEGQFDGLPLYEEKNAPWFHKQLSHIFRDSRHFALEEYADIVPSLGEIGHNALEKYYLPGFPPSASHRWLELMTYVLHDLNATLDAASMLNSIEVRVPFLDHRIVQGVLSWTGERLVTPRYGRKAPLKHWLMRDFPSTFFNRPKQGFSIDTKELSKISNAGAGVFKQMQKSGFLQMKKSDRSGNYARDRIYLEQACLVYSLWKSSALTAQGAACASF